MDRVRSSLKNSVVGTCRRGPVATRYGHVLFYEWSHALERDESSRVLESGLEIAKDAVIGEELVPEVDVVACYIPVGTTLF